MSRGNGGVASIPESRHEYAELYGQLAICVRGSGNSPRVCAFAVASSQDRSCELRQVGRLVFAHEERSHLVRVAQHLQHRIHKARVAQIAQTRHTHYQLLITNGSIWLIAFITPVQKLRKVII